MRHLRSSTVLLGLCVVAIAIAALRVTTARPDLPTGSSYSQAQDGAEALYRWASALDMEPERLEQVRVAGSDPPEVLLVLQPETIVNDRTRRAFEAVPRAGGRLVLAGDSFTLRMYAREFDVTLEPADRSSVAVTPDGSLSFDVSTSDRVRADDGQPLLLAENGDWLAVEKPHLRGTVIVVATAEPMTNRGLRDPEAARFVYRYVLSPALGGTFAFDETHHAWMPTEPDEASVNDLLFATSAGQAAVAAAIIVFVFLLLAGRRLGPPLPARPPAAMRRTMFEHVQMLAGLYRRSGQLDAARSALGRHYGRLLARGTLASESSTRLARSRAASQSSCGVIGVARRRRRRSRLR